MSSPQLSDGAIYRAQGEGNKPERPVLQVINIKPLAASGDAGQRYRLVVSDGVHYQQAMLATQLNEMVTGGALVVNSVVQLEEYIVNKVANKQIIIILKMAVVQQQVAEKIGDPRNVDTAVAAAGGPGAAAGAAAAPQRAAAPRPASSSYNLGAAAGHGGAGAGAPFNQPTMPIRALNPYNKTGWYVKGRVTRKGDVRTYTNQRGEGKLFSFDILDADGGEIRVTMFNSTVDRFYATVELGKVYVVGNGQLKPANKRFSNLKNEYEITLNDHSTVHFVGEDASIASQSFEFVPLEKLAAYEANQTVDVLGVVVAVGPLTTITSQRTQRDMEKRTITLVDSSSTSIEYTMWRDQAKEHTENTLGNAAIVAIKGARTSDFNGVSLNSGFDGAFIVEPDLPEAHKLRQWYDERGGNVQAKSLSAGGGGGRGGPLERFTIEGARAAGKGSQTEKADFYEVRGTITFLKHDTERTPWYMACLNCKKKVQETGTTGADGTPNHHCEKCNKEVEAAPRYILSVLCADWTDQQWTTAFNDTAQALLKHSAADLKKMVDNNQLDEYEAVFKKANFQQFVFKLRARMEMVQDEQRTKVSLEAATPLDFCAESRTLLQAISQY